MTNDYEIKDGILIKYHGHDQAVVVPEGIIAIGDSAFKDNESIVSVELPSSLRRIDQYAFFHCKLLSKIKLDKALEFIGYGAFQFTKMKDVFYNGTIEEFGALKTALPQEFDGSPLFSFSDSSSESLNLFGAYNPVLHCKDVKDDYNHLMCKLQGLLEENEQ